MDRWTGKIIKMDRQLDRYSFCQTEIKIDKKSDRQRDR